MRAPVTCLAFVAGSTVSFLSLAVADVPAALDRVPTEATAAAALQSIEKFDSKLKKLFTTLHLDAGEGEFAALTAIMNTPGLNRAGSLAVALMKSPNPEKPGKDAMDEGDMLGQGPVVVIVPVTDAAKFIEAFGGDAKELKADAVIELDGPADAPEFPGPMFAKDLGGGYIAMGPMKDIVTAFNGAAGRLPAHTKALGANGKRIADTSDWLIVSNIEASGKQIKHQMEEMKQQAGMAMQMAGGGNPQMMDLAQRAGDAFIRDAQVGIVGIGLGDNGVWFDVGAQFKEGSESAKLMQGKSGASKLTSRIPDQPFIFAMSIDSTQPGVKSLFSEVMKAASTGSADKGPVAPSMWTDLGKMTDKLDGMSTIIGSSAGLMAGGLLANSVTYISTKDPAAYTALVKDTTTQVDKKTIDGISFATKYEEAATDIAGTKVDKYSVTCTVDPNAPMAMQVNNMMMMFYGATNGPAGFIGKVNGGVVQTMSTNTPLMTAAMESAKSGKGLADNEQLKAVAAKLPADRAMELFIGVRPILDMAAGFLPGADKAPANIPPIAMGMTATEGGGQFRIYVPNEVFQTIAGFMEEGGGDDAMEDAPAEEKGKPPRF